jgi:hypothetical protein
MPPRAKGEAERWLHERREGGGLTRGCAYAPWRRLGVCLRRRRGLAAAAAAAAAARGREGARAALAEGAV